MKTGFAFFSLILMFSPSFSYADSFEDMVTSILAQDELLKSESLSIEASREELVPKSFLHLPEVTTSASTSRLYDGSKTQSSSNISLSASAVVFNGGHDSLVRDEAKKRTQKLDLESSKKVLERTATVAQDLIEFVSKNKSLMEREKWLKSRRNILENAEIRFKKGLLAGEEWIRLKIDFDNAQNEFEQSKIELDVISGRYHIDRKQLEQLSWPWLHLIGDRTASSFKSFPPATSSLDARIDEVSLEASSIAIKAERRRYFPEFSLSAGISRNFNEDNLPSDVQKSTTLAVSLPLFSRFQTESQINSLVKQQASEKSRAEYQSSENKRMVDFLIQDIKRLTDRLNNNNGISKSARDVMEKSRDKFLQGKISANDFNSDESRYINLYDSWLKDMESLHKDFIVLCKNTSVDIFACVDSLK